MESLPQLDPAAFERLRHLGGDAFLGKMIALFLSYGGAKLAEAQVALQAGNWPGVAAAVHALKSSAGNLGALQVQRLAESVEQSAKAAAEPATRREVAALLQAFAELRPALEAELAKVQTGALQKPTDSLA